MRQFIKQFLGRFICRGKRVKYVTPPHVGMHVKIAGLGNIELGKEVCINDYSFLFAIGVVKLLYTTKLLLENIQRLPLLKLWR
jgi:hypothetical protein